MAFPPFRPPGQDKPSPARAGRKRSEPAAPALSVDELRRQARVRLLGALVLVAAAIIGLPMLFSSQPRPVAVQAPVVIPDRDQVAPLPPPSSAALRTTRCLPTRTTAIWRMWIRCPHTTAQTWRFSIRRREHRTVVYQVEGPQKQLETLILPIRGYGLWSTLHGFIALKNDLNTVVG